MSLLQRVATHLAAQEVPVAAIGASVAEEVERHIGGLPRESRDLRRRLSSR